MFFKLCNGSSSFQSFINEILHYFLNVFCTVYLNDILIYSDNKKKHNEHIHLILTCLWEFRLYVNIEKCVFKTWEVPYLSLFIGVDSICMDPQKIATITDWFTSIKLKQVQSFLEFINFYYCFIINFFKIAKSLTHLIWKDTPFSWTLKCQHAFEELKQAFIITSVLQNFNLEKPVTLETDASDYVAAGVLSQPNEEGNLHSVIFFSSKMFSEECNYEIYNKKLLIIVKVFKKWHFKIHSTPDPVIVLTDYKNLKYFTIICKLNHHQDHWNKFLSEFNFNIIYQSRVINSVTDALTCCADNSLCNEKDPIRD